MADLKISELSALAGANLVAADELAIVDDSASETKKITVSDLIANGVTLISDDTIPGAKILFGAGDVSSAAIADSAVATAKIADDAVTAAKLADESTVDLVTTLPASGAFTGQLALDTDDNNLYLWDGSAWQNIVAPGSVNTVSGSTTGEINIVASTSGSTVTISATIDNTTSAAQFLAGPTGSGGTVGYRTIVGTDLPVATTSDKGGVVVNGNGLVMDGDTLEIDNTVTSSATHHVVTYDANGLITGGRVIASADLPIATNAAVGGVIAGNGLTVDVTGNLSIDNSVTPGTYTKVTVTSEGVISAGDTLAAADIPDHSAAKLTSGTIGTSLIANDAITSDKMADQSTTKFGGAAGSDNVTIFPTGDFKGQFFYDETTQDLYIYTGSSFVPITVLSGNLVNAGAYNASTNQMSSVTSAGSSAGFSVGAALPAPAQTNLNHYVVVDTSGTGTGAAPAVALAPPDMLLSQGVGTEYSLIDVSNAIAGQTASNISFIATGNIIATNVQSALQEVDTEKLAKAGDTMTGALGIGTASSIVFEGSTADDYETTLTVTDPTADRTITFPDVTGNVVTTGDTGTVTSTMILDGTIVNADINASAEIAVSKLADGAARQLLQTDAAGTGVEWASNIDIPGTLDVTSAATFDSTVTATGLITANGKVSFPAATAAAPGLYSGTDVDTGIYAPGANEFGVATAGTSRLVIDSSGNLGVGTTSPGYTLDVNGPIRSDGTSGGLYFGGNSTTPAVGSAIHRPASDTLAFVTASTERARLDSSGRLLVGTSSAISGSSTNDNLQLVNSAGSILSIATSDTTISNGTRIGEIEFWGQPGSTWGHFASITVKGDATANANDNPGRIEFSTTADGASSPTERLRIDSSGRLLIGRTSTSNPHTLQVQADSGANGISVIGRSADDQSEITFYENDNTTVLAQIQQISDRTVIRHRTGYLRFDAGGTTERMRIDSSGNVGIGTTSPTTPLGIVSDSGAVALTIHNRTADDYGYLRFQNNAGTETQAYIGCERTGTSAGNLLFETSGSERMRIDSSGRLLVGTSTNIRGGVIQAARATAETEIQIIESSDSGQGPKFSLTRTRGSNLASPSAIEDGNILGKVSFNSWDGAAYREGVSISAFADGQTWTSGDCPARLVFSTTADGASSPTERMRIGQNGYINFHERFNTNPAAAGVSGLTIRPEPLISLAADGNNCFNFGRNTNDGNIVLFYQAGTQEGSISVSGSTVSYNGAHLARWSQLPGGTERTEILRGSVLSNIDEMCEWGDEDNEQLNRMKISDVEGDCNVSGVFQAWDEDDDEYTDDFYCAMTGDFIIRIGKDVTVARGDLLMSAGDGTAKPQDDDIIRSKTIAKVTSTHVSETYADGSYCVPCVLMAC